MGLAADVRCALYHISTDYSSILFTQFHIPKIQRYFPAFNSGPHFENCDKMDYDKDLEYQECVFDDAVKFASHLIQTLSEKRASGIVKRIVYTNVPQASAMSAVNALEENGLACL